MRKQSLPVSASQPASKPLISRHTHEVIFRTTESTIVMHCYSQAGAEITARWERPDGADVEVVKVRG